MSSVDTHNTPLDFPEEYEFFNCRLKYFADDYIKLTCFNRSIFNPYKVKKSRHNVSQKETYVPNNKTPDISPTKKRERVDSIKRAKDKVYEIAYANNFTYFVTLTIDKAKLSRTDEKEILKSIKILLSNLVQRKILKYILIPEHHIRTENNNKKAIHFHGLISGEHLEMVDSGKTYQGKPIYNWNDWKYGFSTAIPLDNHKGICQYITKYITKESDKIFGKYYFSGGNINRHVPTEYYNVDYESIPGKEYEIIPANMKVKYQIIELKEVSDD